MQQRQYSAYFTRYLCAMMANLPSNVEVFELAENLFEELGFAGDEETLHYLLYRNMLEDFGLSLKSAPPTAATRKLIETMFSSCRNTRSSVGLAALCLGAEDDASFYTQQLGYGFDEITASSLLLVDEDL